MPAIGLACRLLLSSKSVKEGVPHFLPKRNTTMFGVISSAGSCSLERVLVMMKSKQQDFLFGSHKFDETAPL
jgi:hypothetical protein